MTLRDQHSTIAPAILKAVQDAAKVFGMNAKAHGSWRYTDDSVRVTFDIAKPGGVDIPMQALKSLCLYHKFDLDKMLEPFEYAGLRYKLVGYSSRARKMPFIAQCLSQSFDKRYKFPESIVYTAKGIKVPWME